MYQSFKIRKAEREDFAQVRLDAEKFEINVLNETFGRFDTYVAEQDGKICGLIELSTHKTDGEIVTFTARKGYKNSGVGKQLLDAAETYFKKRKIQKVYVESASMKSALDYYKRSARFRLHEGKWFGLIMNRPKRGIAAPQNLLKRKTRR